MIRDARTLQPEFVPSEVRHRDGEVDALEAALEPITRGEPAEIPFLYGPSGTGKTCIAKHMVTSLRESVVDINHQYVNCWRAHAPFRALYRILDGIDRAVDIHRQSTPHDELLDRLEQYDGPPYIVILDEVDQLEDKHPLYDLYHNSQITMVLIATQQEDLFADLDSRIASRLHGAETIRFRPYSDDQLVTILEDRVQWGLEDGAITNSRLERVADAAAGDARIAISILRDAARRARQSKADTITDDILTEAIPTGHQEVRQADLDSLKPVQRTLYDIIHSHGELPAQQLYTEYEDRTDSETRVGRRQLRRHLNKLADYSLIRINGATRNRRYSTVHTGS
jgi:Cdc6-like AAA superfamily ATPase